MKLGKFFRIITVYARIFLFINIREKQYDERIRILFLKAGKMMMLTVYEFFSVNREKQEVKRIRTFFPFVQAS